MLVLDSFCGHIINSVSSLIHLKTSPLKVDLKIYMCINIEVILGGNITVVYESQLLDVAINKSFKFKINSDILLLQLDLPIQWSLGLKSWDGVGEN